MTRVSRFLHLGQRINGEYEFLGESKSEITSLFRVHSPSIHSFSLLPHEPYQNLCDDTSIQFLVSLFHIIL